MLPADRDQQTICSVSTPHGVGGISVIRVSGKEAYAICRKLASFLPSKIQSHQMYYGILRDLAGTQIDEVVLGCFDHGRSFTGEETVEISCHGSPVICDQIMRALVSAGCRTADRGEFTYRSFMNGRIDLVQAESVLALIESKSKSAAKLALRQLQGDLSDLIGDVEDHLTWILANIEAGIDFSTEDIEVVDRPQILSRLDQVVQRLEGLVDSFKQGRILRDGIQMVLSGAPNVGKSSLLNLLLQEKRAIVTDIAGTTRDMIDGETIYEGTRFRFIDTAGLRKSEDVVERMGIERSYSAQKEADVVLFVYDIESGLTKEEVDNLNQLDPKNTLIVGNKVDKAAPNTGIEGLKRALNDSEFMQKIQSFEDFSKRRVFFVSALDKSSRDLLLKGLVQEFASEPAENTVLLSQARQFENLSLAVRNCKNAAGLVQQGLGLEYLSVELKEALIAVQETLGKRFDDQIMDRVFKEFCIGK